MTRVTGRDQSREPGTLPWLDIPALGWPQADVPHTAPGSREVVQLCLPLKQADRSDSWWGGWQSLPAEQWWSHCPCSLHWAMCYQRCAQLVSPSSRNQLPSIQVQVFLAQQGLAGASLHFASGNFPFELAVAETQSEGFSLSCDFKRAFVIV